MNALDDFRKYIPALFLVLFLFSNTAHAARYNYSLGGFSGGVYLNDGTKVLSYSGGRVFGYFEGEDTVDISGNPGSDGKIIGQISLPQANEMTSFFIDFEGNPFFDILNSSSNLFIDPFGVGFLNYDILGNSLVLGRSGDTAFSGSFTDTLSAATGHNYFSIFAFGGVETGIQGTPNRVSYDVFFINEGDVFDQDGNVVDPSKRIGSITLTTNEQIQVTQVPLPGALLFFISGLFGLRAFGLTKNKLNS